MRSSFCFLQSAEDGYRLRGGPEEDGEEQQVGGSGDARLLGAEGDAGAVPLSPELQGMQGEMAGAASETR